MSHSGSRVTRRPPPGARGSGHMVLSSDYGPGHRGFFDGGHMDHWSGPANHPHVPAIEVALHHKSIGEVAYTLMAVNVPLSEVLATFCEEAGLDYSEYALEHDSSHIAQLHIADGARLSANSHRRRLGSKDTSESLGLDPYTEWPAAVLEVVEVGTKRTTAALGALNSLGAALCISRSGADVQSEHLTDVDMLSVVFDSLDLNDLLSVAQTCVLWHIVAQRVSLLFQLQCSAPPSEDYPTYLRLLAEHSELLDGKACRKRAAERQQWASLGLTKEAPAGPFRDRTRWDRPCMFTKAAGCRTMRTVAAACPADEVRRIALPLRSAQTAFMVASRGEPLADRRHGPPLGDALLDEVESLAFRLEATRVGDEAGTTSPAAGPAAAAAEAGLPERNPTLEFLESTRAIQQLQEQTWSRNQHKEPVVTRVADAALREVSIELFRKYFSPSMHLIFPLIAYQQALHGLDFTTTETWGVGIDGELVGAVAWRVREPLMRAHARDAARMPARTLEVLFISVREEHRKMDYGGVLVAALEEEARDRGCAMLYVEVGDEQPLARKFWAKRGFAPAREAGVSCEQRLFFDHACLRFSDTQPFIKCLPQ